LRHVAAGEDCELQKILAQTGSGALRHILVEEEPAKLLSRAQNLTPAMAAPATISNSEIEQFQSPVERAFKPLRVPSFPAANRSINLAADVPQLLREGEHCPPSGGQIVVHRHGLHLMV